MAQRKKSIVKHPCCMCSVSVMLTASAGCSDDAAAVSVLPNQWEPKRSGKILEDYLKERQKKHDQLLEELKIETNSLNEKLDSSIRVLAENLLATISDNQNSMNCACVPNEQNLTVDDVEIILSLVQKLRNERIEEIERFKKEALEMERQRADGIRNVLRSQCQCLVKNAHKSPTEIVQDLDALMYDINQQLLSNIRAYNDLECQLVAQADEDVVKAKCLLNQFFIELSVLQANAGEYNIDTKLTPLVQKTNEDLLNDNNTSSTKKFSRSFLKQCYDRMLTAYRMAVTNLYTGYSGEISLLHRAIGSIRADDEEKEQFMTDMQFVADNLAHRITTSKPSEAEIYSFADCDKNDMTTIFIYLSEALKQTYSVLYDAAHLWDAHIMRSAQAQKITITAVEDLMSSNDNTELMAEITLNLALEQMMCASEPGKVLSLFDGILVLLNTLKENCEKHGESEITKLEEFMQLPAIMVAPLLFEFNSFLNKYPIDLPEPQSSESSQPGFGMPSLPHRPQPSTLYQTEMQVVALNNWKNGFLEAFHNNLASLPDMLTEQAKTWINERSPVLIMRNSMKTLCHTLRKERMVKAKECRLAELAHHEDRLCSHLRAMAELTERLPAEAANYLEIDSPELHPLCKWVDNTQAKIDDLLVQENLDPEYMRLRMLSYEPRLATCKQLFVDSVDNIFEHHKKQIEQSVQAARISNFRYLKQIKMFSEGGKYAAPEALKSCASLLKSSELLETSLVRTLDALNQRRTQLLTAASHYSASLESSIDVYAKGGKGKDSKKSKQKSKLKLK